MIEIAADLVRRMRAHAESELPNECCGVLVGVISPERVEVREIHPADNVWEGDRTHRFLLDPKQQLCLQRDCRERGLELVGFYHSHPDGTATPSAFDAEMAWPEVIHLIVAMREGRTDELRCWQLGESTVAFTEQRIEIT